MKVLIIGSNGLLARTFIKEKSKNISKLYATASSSESINNIEINGDIETYSLSFKSRESISSFFANQFEALDLILFCASPFEGTLRESRFDGLDIWSNAYEVAIKVAKLASDKLKPTGKLIYIGSVVGYQGQIAASCVPYSVFKGTLSLLVEGYNKEVSKQAYYINLGGFRDIKSEEYLSVDEVVTNLGRVLDGDFVESHVNVVSEKDKMTYKL